ncbi:hypothetical protein [Oceanobacillus neutriphilus]|uniref:hypothetical protein n=1 Tax=Oceanobacillus neutriphilus TaxID=531815 RepID=UPI0016669977|nr:hypothetical protein [Oceanobacillus neutriphilus]
MAITPHFVPLFHYYAAYKSFLQKIQFSSFQLEKPRKITWSLKYWYSSQGDVRCGKSLSAGNASASSEEVHFLRGLHLLLFPQESTSLRSHLRRNMFYLLFHKEIKLILATVFDGASNRKSSSVGRVTAVPVPEEIHGDSCGNAQNERKFG